MMMFKSNKDFTAEEIENVKAIATEYIDSEIAMKHINYRIAQGNINCAIDLISFVRRYNTGAFRTEILNRVITPKI